MAINEKAKVILLKLETTEGIDAAPDGTDALLTRNFTTTPLEVDSVERNLDLPVIGGTKVAVTNPRQTHNFELELAGSGTADTPAKWSRALEICGMAAPSVIADPDPDPRVEMAFGSSPYASATLYHWYENQRRRALGVRSTFSMNFEAGQIPFMSMQSIGLLPDAPFDVATPPVPDFSAFQQPVEVNTVNTSFTLDGYAAALRSLEFEAGAAVSVRNLVGNRRINRGNHAITGTAVIEAPDVSTKNYLETLNSGAEIALALQHGTTAGNVVAINMDHVQLTAAAQQNEDDVLMFSLSFRANVLAGSDDILITTK